jgi:hypothetical protein
MVTSRLSWFALLAALFLAPQPSFAVCKPTPHYRYVGDMTPVTGDPLCTDNDIQSAIDHSPCPTTIVITRERSYTNEALTINNQSLTLTAVGDGVPCGINPATFYCDPSVASCTNPPPTQPVVTITGGQPNKSVLTITGTSNVTLQYLEVTGGNLSSSQRGGGIFFGDAGSGGYGTLTLDTVTVDHNTAGYGGGISFSPGPLTSTPIYSSLTLLPNTLILENTAVNDGGGIRIEEGAASLFALRPQTLIAYNSALNGYGGGIVVVDGLVDIGSPGYNGSPVLQYNNAQAGGGAIAAFRAGSVRLFTTDSQHPVQVSNNSTSGLGGAVYLKGEHVADFYQGFNARLCAFNYQIDNNIGVSGAAIYADIDPDNGYSVADLNPPDECGPSGSLSAEGAVACAVPCNQMRGNIAENPNTSLPTGGSIVGVSFSYFRVNKLDLRGSIAGDLIEQAGASSSVSLNTCLLADNHTGHELVGSSYLSIDNCTIANNTIDDGYVLYVPVDGSGLGSLKLANTIIEQPTHLTVDFQPNIAGLTASNLILDTGSFPIASPDIIAAYPTFVDAANGDYHLRATSWGIDFAPMETGGASADLDGNPRNVDLVQAPNLFGPRDLGAYERQFLCTADTVFCDGFDTIGEKVEVARRRPVGRPCTQFACQSEGGSTNGFESSIPVS